MAQNGAVKNMRLLSHKDLGGFGNVGEGMAIQLARDGRRILWLGHESAPKNFTAVDVTDPRKPSVIVQTDLPHGDMRSNNLELLGDLLMVPTARRHAVEQPGAAGRPAHGPVPDEPGRLEAGGRRILRRLPPQPSQVGRVLRPLPAPLPPRAPHVVRRRVVSPPSELRGRLQTPPSPDPPALSDTRRGPHHH